MAKVRCNLCSNEVSGVCKVKKSSVRTNKPRNCKDYIYDESKLKVRTDVPTIKLGYRQQEENRRRMKEELKRLKEELKKGPAQGTANDLGLVQNGSSIILPGDTKHPVTGDLSRFITTASDKE